MYMFIKSPRCTIFLTYISIQQQQKKTLEEKNKVIKSSGEKGVIRLSYCLNKELFIIYYGTWVELLSRRISIILNISQWLAIQIYFISCGYCFLTMPQFSSPMMHLSPNYHQVLPAPLQSVYPHLLASVLHTAVTIISSKRTSDHVCSYT